MKHSNKINYWQLSELGSTFGFSFSSHEVLGNKIFGLDGTKRKLLIVEKLNGQHWPSVIDIDDISSIAVKITYRNIQAGELKRKEIEDFLESISLQFTFSNGTNEMNLVFYEDGVNQVKDLHILEKKARNWQAMLSKMAISKVQQPNKQKGNLSNSPVGASVPIRHLPGIINL
jgi:hypothetical protein